MNIHYLQHIPFEGPASIESWAASREHSLSGTRLYQGEPLPNLEAIDYLIVLGGPMNIYEESQYPWLVQEKRLIEQAIKQDKRILGICLGAQLIADVLGARVMTNPYREIGWFPIEFTDAAQASPAFKELPKRLNVFHWHSDTFELPSGAIHLAISEACQNQAFIYGEHVLALQFHLESTPSSVEALLEHCADEIIAGKYVQKPGEMSLQESNFKTINSTMYQLLDQFSKQAIALQP